MPRMTEAEYEAYMDRVRQGFPHTDPTLDPAGEYCQVMSRASGTSPREVARMTARGLYAWDVEGKRQGAAPARAPRDSETSLKGSSSHPTPSPASTSTSDHEDTVGYAAGIVRFGVALVRIVLPYPTTANHLWKPIRTAKGLGLAKTESAKAFAAAAARIASTANVRPYRGNLRLRMTLDMYRPQKRGDLDNVIKVCQDALIGSVVEDDEMIVSIVANRHEDKLNPRVVVEIREVE